MRRFIRHPLEVPIQIDEAAGAKVRGRVLDVGKGGLCFHVEEPIEVGRRLQLQIDVRRPFKADCVVVWCRPSGASFDVGVQFADEATLFAARMVEQACWIEEFRVRMRDEAGRELTTEEAALEWVERFADSFDAMQESPPKDIK